MCLFSIPGRVLGSDEEGEEEEEDNEEDADAFMKEQQAKLELEKEAILGNQSLIAEVGCYCFRSVWGDSKQRGFHC